MKIARDEAWKFATDIAEKEGIEWTDAIKERDKGVAKLAKIIDPPG